MANTYIALDIETTGLDPKSCSIIEIGAVRFDEAGNVIDTFSELANPDERLPKEIEKLCGINDQMLEQARKPWDVWKDFEAWSGNGSIYLSHNAKFEARFIKALYSRVGEVPDYNFICTYEVAKNRLKGLSSYKLMDLVPGNDEDRHRALPDALACVELYKKLASTYKTGKIPNKTYLTHISQYEMYEKPTERQLSYITSLGGDPTKPTSRNDASTYIDELKYSNKSPRLGKKSTDHKTIGAQIRQTIATLAFVIVFVFLVVGWLID